MTTIEIRPLSATDETACGQLARAAIRFAAVGDGCDPDVVPWVEEGVRRAQTLVRDALDRPGSRCSFLVATIDDTVVGMIGQASPSEIIRNALPDLSNTVPEIICLFVDPVHHRCGIGRALFLEIIIEIRRLGIDRYVLDCGYRSSQEFWRRILGKPSMTLKDHWAIGYDHLIWSLEL